MLDKFNIEKIFKTLFSNGGDYGDIFFENKNSSNIVFENGKIEKIQSGIDSGIGIRLLHDNKTFYGFTTDFSEKSLFDTAQKLANFIKSNNSNYILPIYESSSLLDEKIVLPSNIKFDNKVEKILTAKNFLEKYSKKIVQFKIVYSDMLQNVEIINSNGNYVKDTRVQIIFLSQVIAAKDDLIQTGYEAQGGSMGFEFFEKNNVEDICRLAADRAIKNLDAKKIKGGNMSVVLSSDAGGTMIHEAIGHGLEADIVNDGMSVYTKDKIGKKIASEKITVIDDGTIPFKRGTQFYDDEGNRCQKTVLVENGILKNYIYDVLNSLKDGVKSTGNGRRESFRFKPIPRMTNTYIASGNENPEAIIKSIDSGLFVKKMGGGQVNTITGDFVFEVSEGYEIVNGEIGDRVRDTTLIGNGPDVLNKIDMVGNDLGFGVGTCGKDGQGVPVSDAQPTLRIPEIVVG
jgi:TldD protein